MTTPACTNVGGIATNRFLLGVFEAVVNPGFLLVMAMWFRSDEQPLRLVIYYCMNGVAGIFGGVLGYAIGHITTGLQQWQYIFLIFGSISITWATIFLFFMPNLPSTARFLTAQEKVLAVERVAANRQGVKNHHFKMYQVWQAIRDPKTWILFIMAIAAQIPNAAQSTFTSIILESFGLTALQTQYMQMPGNAIQIVSLLLSGYISSHFPNMRCITMIIGNLICVGAGGALVSLNTNQQWGRLVALWMCSCQSVVKILGTLVDRHDSGVSDDMGFAANLEQGFAMSLVMVSSNVTGYTKKQVTGAALFVGYCVGNIIGPQTFLESEAPQYTSAYIAILIGYSVKTVMVIVLYTYMYAVNKKRDRDAVQSDSSQNGMEQREAVERGMQDMTELDNKGFRYVL